MKKTVFKVLCFCTQLIGIKLCHFECEARKISNNERNHPMRSFALRLKMTEYSHVKRSETSHGMFTSFKKLIAFSLVELMISLITISCIAAAFTPVITKKLKKQDIALSLAQTSEITSECAPFGFPSECKLCTKAYCVTCEKSCPTGQYAESKSCTCKNCSEHDKIKNDNLTKTKCVSCNNDGCNACNNAGSDEGKYYIDKGLCKDCPKDTYKDSGGTTINLYICDGINKTDKSKCNAPENSGYVCKNGIRTLCKTVYSSTCETCNATRCLSCIQAHYLTYVNGKYSCDNWCNTCGNCTDANNCKDCWIGGLLDATSHLCNKTCKDFMPNCYSCTGNSISSGFYGTSNNGAILNPNVKCTACNSGYYLADSRTCKPCSAINNCILCNNSGKCTKCLEGYYVNKNDSSGKTCTACTKSNCAQCDTDGKCLICNQHYHLENGDCVVDDNKFNCQDDNFMRVGKLCVTRKNMGDASVLKIPSTISVVSSDNGEYCYPMNGDKCCWKGNTSGTSCSSDYVTYSGCNRTQCDFYAAKEICENFNYAGKKWRLPKNHEVDWAAYSIGLGDNGLRLCGGYKSPSCSEPNKCWGAASGSRCKCYCMHSFEGDAILISNGVTTIWGNVKEEGKSVRCVTEME